MIDNNTIQALFIDVCRQYKIDPNEFIVDYIHNRKTKLDYIEITSWDTGNIVYSLSVDGTNPIFAQHNIAKEFLVWAHSIQPNSLYREFSRLYQSI